MPFCVRMYAFRLSIRESILALFVISLFLPSAVSCPLRLLCSLRSCANKGLALWPVMQRSAELVAVKKSDLAESLGQRARFTIPAGGDFDKLVSLVSQVAIRVIVRRCGPE